MSDATHTTISAKCAYFGSCGGCQLQDRSYEEQLALKQARLQDLVAEFWNSTIPIHASPIQWHYRNKVDMNWALKQYEEKPPDDFVRETVLGFNKKSKWYHPLDIELCHIGPESTTTITAASREWASDQCYRAVDRRGKNGLLRILLHREARRTGEGMVALITSDEDMNEDSFVDAVLNAYPATSIYRGIYRGNARGAFADEMKLLYGNETIDEVLHIPDGESARELRFRISPFSFFQTNTLATEVLYGLIRAWVRDVSPTVLYDLYGGAGGIAFSCSDLVDVVRSVEVVESATADGEHNATVNDIDNVFFTTEKIRSYLQQINEQGGMEPNSAVVVDPPREGMTPKPLKRLIHAAPPNILYISCKPSVFAVELEEFTKRYDIEWMQAVDLFPQTDHVELVTAMRLK